MENDKNRRILIIDDNRAIHEDFHKILDASNNAAALDAMDSALFGPANPSPAIQRQRYELDSAYQGQEGFEKVRRAIEAGRPYAMAFVDMRMPPGWDGVQTIEKIWQIDPDIQIVICTAYSDYSWDDILAKFGRIDRLLILKKPFDMAEVCQLACALTEKWSLARQAKLKLREMQAMVDDQTGILQAEVAERRHSEAALQLIKERYALAVAGANDGIWDWDVARNRVFYSLRWKAMLGFTEDEISTDPAEWFSRIHPEDLERTRRELDNHLSGGSAQFHSEHRIKSKAGDYRYMLSRGLAVRDSAGAVSRIAGSQTDINDRNLAEEKLRHDSLHDGLTGLANRVMLMVQINQCMRRARRLPNYLFAVLFLDLDRFKLINDSLGHDAGDQVLQEIAARLLAALRGADSVTRWPEDVVARPGGDEFVLVLETIRVPADATRVADRMLKALAKPIMLNGHEVVVCASIGIAVSSSNYERAEDILRDADIALYHAKREGKGRARIFDPEMHDAAVQRLWMETELGHAIDAGELILHYQPILSASTGTVVEVEALVRWQHPERGLIPPADFIPLAEETGLIVPLGNWVLKTACQQLRQWDSSIAEFTDVVMAVNVSGRQLVRAEFVSEAGEILKETGLSPHRVKIEITESAMIENGATAMATLTRLRQAGLQLHMDDFGSGYSSLNYLHRLPFECLKIDCSFIREMDIDHTKKPIVEAIVTLGHTLGMKVLAEGVETGAHAVYLRELGCDFLQGFYFAKPLPADQAAAYVRERNQIVALPATGVVPITESPVVPRAA